MKKILGDIGVRFEERFAGSGLYDLGLRDRPHENQRYTERATISAKRPAFRFTP
jgi:hypothetical protein